MNSICFYSSTPQHVKKFCLRTIVILQQLALINNQYHFFYNSNDDQQLLHLYFSMQLSIKRKKNLQSVQLDGFSKMLSCYIACARGIYIIYFHKKLSGSFDACIVCSCAVRTCRLERRLLAASTHAFVHGPKILWRCIQQRRAGDWGDKTTDHQNLECSRTFYCSFSGLAEKRPLSRTSVHLP